MKLGIMVNYADKSSEHYIVECSQKRKKLRLQCMNINCLLDELLVEILCRLQSTRSAMQCKCVCKRWSALISRPYFITKFTAVKFEKSEPSIQAKEEHEEEEQRDIHFVARIAHIRHDSHTWRGLSMCLSNPVSNLHGFSFSSIPCLEDGTQAPHLTVVGSCNDLLLLSREEELGRCKYYICNARTKHWLQLPTPPFVYGQHVHVGFICDPCYSYNKDGNPSSSNILVNLACRYCIVVVPYARKAASEFRAHLLSSTNHGQWTETLLSLPIECRMVQLPTFGFAFRGMLHFRFSEKKGMIVFDPYNASPNGITHCRFIGCPKGFPHGVAHIEVRNKELQMTGFCDKMTLHIWSLKDYKTGEWLLRHKIAINEWVLQHRRIARHRRKDRNVGFVLGTHPTNPQIVYLLGPRWIAMCNAQTRTMEVVSRVSASMRLFPCFNSFPLSLPIWPTPLPNLAHDDILSLERVK